MADATTAGGEVLPVLRFDNLRHAALASLYLGLSFTWLPYPLVVLPEAVQGYYPHDYNTYIGLFPNSLFAGWAGFHRNDNYFKTPEAARLAPKVEFPPAKR